MSEEAALGMKQFKIKKRFERDDDDESRVRPAYINLFEFARFGNDVYLDACVMPIDDLIGVEKGGGGEVESIVLDRYVMSMETFVRLRDAVEKMHQQLTEQGALPINATFIPGYTK